MEASPTLQKLTDHSIELVRLLPLRHMTGVIDDHSPGVGDEAGEANRPPADR